MFMHVNEGGDELSSETSGRCLVYATIGLALDVGAQVTTGRHLCHQEVHRSRLQHAHCILTSEESHLLSTMFHEDGCLLGCSAV
jgi:hypothetical protein